MKTLILAAAAAVAMTVPALADPIEGNWRTESGQTANIAKCGSSFCITLKTGDFAGRRIGKVKLSGAKYVGTLTDPEDDRTYSGTGRINGNTLSMTGCALRIFCKTQHWLRI